MDPHPPLTIRQIRTIAAVANGAGLVRASEVLNASPSTLSRTVAEAEASLGHRLFQRGWLGMEPTSEGEVVVARCQRAVAIVASAGDALRAAGARASDLAHHLTWPLLDVVDAVRRTGSVSAAAALLGLSQPDVSRALAKVAAATGRHPFRRVRTGMAPTDDAVLLSGLRTKLHAELSPLREEVGALARETTGRVAVGLLPFSEQDIVAKVFGRMLGPHRHVRLQAVTGSYGALTDALRRGELDLVLGPLRDPPPFDDLEERPLLDERFAVVARAGHRWAHGAPTLRDLAAETWVVAPHGTPTRLYFESLLLGEGLAPPARTCEIVTFYLAEQAVIDSDAIGLLTYSDRKRAAIRDGLTILPVALPDSLRRVGVTLRKGARPSAAQQIFLDATMAEALRQGQGGTDART